MGGGGSDVDEDFHCNRRLKWTTSSCKCIEYTMLSEKKTIRTNLEIQYLGESLIIHGKISRKQPVIIHLLTR